MKSILPVACAVLALCTASLSRAQQKPPDLAAEYDKLDTDFNDALQEYYRPYQEAKTEEESAKIHLDPALDPRKSFLPKFEDLALRAKGSDTGCKCWIWVFSNAGDDQEAQKRAFTAIEGGYVQSAALEPLVQRLVWMGDVVGRQRSDALLERILAESPHDAVRAAVLFTQASGVIEGGKGGAAELAAARAKLERIQKDFGGTRWAARAAGTIFEADHLQIGMQAPDFGTVDQDGKPWKLSDYRGKVVVVDFWGYW